MMTMKIIHPFEPLYDSSSKILILGSFPSVKSREQLFFYGHPQNRFWKIISSLLNEPLPQTIEEKKKLCLKHHVALWDSIQSCEISGSSDASIKNVKTNDIQKILSKTNITKICCNGKTSYNLYEKYIYPSTKIHACCLPSSSPANAAYSFDKLLKEWKEIIL